MRSPSRSGRHSSERAKAATARSISPASRTLTGRQPRTPNDGATVWIAPNWPIPEAMARIPKHRRPRHAGRDLLEQFQPFPAHAVFETGEPGGVAARPRQARRRSRRRPDRRQREHDRHGAGRLQQRRHSCEWPVAAQDDVGRERGQFRRVSAKCGGIGCGPADVDPHIAADRSSPIAPAPAGTPRCRACQTRHRSQPRGTGARRCAASALGLLRAAPRAARRPHRRR